MTVNKNYSTINKTRGGNIACHNKPRLGLINYINSLPYVLPIIDGKVKISAQIILNEPAQLNALYNSQDLDLGAMSAFSFLEQGNLKLMPGVSIASRGAVGSVLFFSKLDIQSPQPLRIAVPCASATAVNLLSLLLLEHTKKQAELIPTANPDLSSPDIDAALVIGDRALLIDQTWSEQYSRYDLGQWWYNTYALPIVFGLFAARRDCPDSVFEEVNEALVKAVKIGLGEYFDAVLEQAQATIALPADRLIRYFRQELNYSWGDEHIRALQKYENLCRQYQLLR